MSQEDIDLPRLEKTLSKTLALLNKAKLNVPELLLLYGNLGYHLGASIAGFRGKGPSQQELEEYYKNNPTVDISLMLQGLLITAWEQDYRENPRLSNLGYKNEGETK